MERVQGICVVTEKRAKTKHAGDEKQGAGETRGPFCIFAFLSSSLPYARAKFNYLAPAASTA